MGDKHHSRCTIPLLSSDYTGNWYIQLSLTFINCTATAYTVRSLFITCVFLNAFCAFLPWNEEAWHLTCTSTSCQLLPPKHSEYSEQLMILINTKCKHVFVPRQVFMTLKLLHAFRQLPRPGHWDEKKISTKLMFLHFPARISWHLSIHSYMLCMQHSGRENFLLYFFFCLHGFEISSVVEKTVDEAC